VKHYFLFLTLLTLLSIFSGCEKQSHEEKQTNNTLLKKGFAPEKLQKIDTFIQQSIQNRTTHGATVLIAKDGEIVYHKAFGKATLDTQMQKDTIFLMYSSSKILPAIAIMKLVEQGKVKLDDPLDKYLPEFKEQKIVKKSSQGEELVPVQKVATIRQVLSMTNGTVGYWNPEYLKYGVDIGDGDPDFDLEENIKRLSKVPLQFEPGSAYEYSMGIDIAGRVVEVASKQSYAEFLEEEIFKPLGMDESFFYPPENKMDQLGVIWHSDGRQLNGKTQPHKFKNQKLFSPGAGVYSTTENYFRLGQMLLNGGVFNNVRVLSQASVDAIRSNQIGDLSVKDFYFYQHGYEKYGLGCFINGKESFRDEGSISVLGLGGKNLELNFEKNILLIVLQTVFPPEPAWRVSEEIARLTYDAIEEK
jgi:CubicO group peptidase (beta-lactamase class C family)